MISKNSKNFALTGVAGYIAPRHLRAIRETGNRLVAAMDPNDSVGVLDTFFLDAKFFTEIERFDRHLEKLRRGPEEGRVHYLTVCSPNYLHDAHCRLGMRVGADVICEKPLVIKPWNLDALRELESETGRRIFTVLQLRYHPKLLALREQLIKGGYRQRKNVCLTYITARGSWYDYSWKGAPEKSGGIVMNIGVHFFDLLTWLFGAVVDLKVFHSDARRVSGFLDLERAKVSWFLSIDSRDLPFMVQPGLKSTYRSITIDGEEIEFTDGFSDLHTQVYDDILKGRGYGIEDAKSSIDTVYRISTAEVSPTTNTAHPYLLKKRLSA